MRSLRLTPLREGCAQFCADVDGAQTCSPCAQVSMLKNERSSMFYKTNNVWPKVVEWNCSPTISGSPIIEPQIRRDVCSIGRFPWHPSRYNTSCYVSPSFFSQPPSLWWWLKVGQDGLCCADRIAIHDPVPNSTYLQRPKLEWGRLDRPHQERCPQFWGDVDGAQKCAPCFNSVLSPQVEMCLTDLMTGIKVRS